MKHSSIEKKKKFLSKCLSCGRYTHNVLDCPRIHLVKKKTSKIAIKNIKILRNLSDKVKKKINRNDLRLNWKVLYGTGYL
jgi:hypothetical protein